MSKHEESRQVNTLLAATLWGGCISGALGLVVAVLALSSGNLVAAAVATAGAGVAFGLIGNMVVH
jgi:hypothetical protein